MLKETAYCMQLVENLVGTMMFELHKGWGYGG